MKIHTPIGDLKVQPYHYLEQQDPRNAAALIEIANYPTFRIHEKRTGSRWHDSEQNRFPVACCLIVDADKYPDKDCRLADEDHWEKVSPSYSFGNPDRRRKAIRHAARLIATIKHHRKVALDS